MTEDHKTVLHSILATLVVTVILFIATIVAYGGFSIDLVKQWVLPLLVSAMVLGVFWIIVYRNYRLSKQTSGPTPSPVS